SWLIRYRSRPNFGTSALRRSVLTNRRRAAPDHRTGRVRYRRIVCSRPTSAMRRSARRSAASAGGMPSVAASCTICRGPSSVPVPDPGQRRLGDVGRDDRSAVLDQVLYQVLADLAEAGDADPPAGQARAAPDVLSRGPHALENAPGGEDRGVPGTTVGLAAPG